MRKYSSVIACIAVFITAFIGYLSLAGFAKEETFTADAYFCPSDDCFSLLASYISNASKADCALYSLKSSSVENALKKAEASVVLGEDRKGRGLMHNKFCVLDDSVVITGSFNPNEGSKSYKNNMVILHSAQLAEEYEKEFEELWKKQFGGGRKGGSSSSIVFFCPEDNCQKHLIDELQKARESIYFMTYSFTDKKIASELLGKEGVEIRGLFDKSQNSKWSVYPMLEGKADVKVYDKAVLHHKVFIIDNSTVITGSYNPTQNGNENNDENMLILHDKDLAASFADEFSRLYSEA